MSVKDKILALADSHLDFIKQAFSDNGTPSSSRLLTVLHSLVACSAVVYIIIRSPLHTIDGGVAAGLGGFATVHYGVNRISNAMQRKAEPVVPPVVSPVNKQQP
jgi:hypothetical protein